jgi:hypothetical protein
MSVREGPMLLIREIFHCKPGKVRPFVEKFHAMARLGEAAGQGKTRILTDFSGVRYWTCVAEFEVPDLAAFERMMAGEGMSEADGKEMQRIMEGYHDLVEQGRREIYRIEESKR